MIWRVVMMFGVEWKKKEKRSSIHRVPTDQSKFGPQRRRGRKSLCSLKCLLTKKSNSLRNQKNNESFRSSDPQAGDRWSPRTSLSLSKSKTPEQPSLVSFRMRRLRSEFLILTFKSWRFKEGGLSEESKTARISSFVSSLFVPSQSNHTFVSNTSHRKTSIREKDTLLNYRITKFTHTLRLGKRYPSRSIGCWIHRLEDLFGRWKSLRSWQCKRNVGLEQILRKRW